MDYGLLAFEWVEANLQALNAQCNEVIGSGKDSFRIPASQLPHGDSWPPHLQGTAEERLFRRGTAGGRHPGADQSQIGSVNKNELETVCFQPAFACAF